jgi:hypothetical protein
MRKSVGQAPTAERENKRNKKTCRTSSDIGVEQENHNVGRSPTLDRKGLMRNIGLYVAQNCPDQLGIWMTKGPLYQCCRYQIYLIIRIQIRSYKNPNYGYAVFLLKTLCIWTTWHGCQANKILFNFFMPDFIMFGHWRWRRHFLHHCQIQRV